MQRIFNEALFKVIKSKLQSGTEISTRVKSIVATINIDESTESKKAFYLFNLMLLISLIFLSPDKILNGFFDLKPMFMMKFSSKETQL